MKVFIILKKNIISTLLCIFLLCLVIFSSSNLQAAKNGLVVWATCVIPSLFPFFIATEMLSHTNIVSSIGKILNKFMRPLFNIPGEGAYAFIMGLLCGCPVGAHIVCNLYNNGICTKDEAERMLAFTNNSGPLFIIGTVGILLFGNTTIGTTLFITHLLSAISVGLLFGAISKFFKTPKQIVTTYKNVENQNNNISISNFGEILTISISKSITNVLQIGGFIVLFSIIISILKKIHIFSAFSTLLSQFRLSNNLSAALLGGILELTNGVTLASEIHSKIISSNIVLCGFLLGFGGLCIALQVLSIISKCGLSIKKYLYGKVLQGLVQAFYTLLLVQNCAFFNFDIPSNEISHQNNAFLIVVFLIMILLQTYIIFTSEKRNISHNSKKNIYNLV